MLTSMATQPQINVPLKPLQSNLLLEPHKPDSHVFFINPKTCNLHLKSFISLPALKVTQTPRFRLPASQPQQVVSEEKPETPAKKEKLGVLVKPMEKPRVVLKFIWMKKIIGIALNQVIPGHGTIPLSPYYFWPKEDAWERLKVLLEGKPWISKKQMHVLLNQATDVIELWQDTGSNL